VTAAGVLWAAKQLSLPALAMVGLLSAFVAVVRVWPQWRKVQADSDASLRGDLMDRIKALETANERDREACEERVNRVEERAEARLEAIETRLEAEVQILRHERNNVRQALNMLFARIKRLDYPELSEIVAEVEDMIVRGDQTIAVEKAAIPAVKGMRR
jgi:hypothetical protein